MTNKKIKKILIIILVATIIIISVLIINKLLFNKTINDNQNLTSQKEIIANASMAFLTSGDEGVKEFIKIAQEKNMKVDTLDIKNCVSVTPANISENSDYRIFKFIDTASTYLLYENDIYELGKGKDGYGAISFALADMDKNNEYELYYTYYWKSGIHRSNIGYFDPIKKESKYFNKSYKDEEVILITNKTNLYIYDSEFTNYYDVANFRTQAGKQLGEILLENGEITFKEKGM